MIGFIAATDSEITDIKKYATVINKTKISRQDFYQCEYAGKSFVMAVSGMGKVNAARCTQTLILKYNVSEVINIGFCGSLSEKAGCGDIVAVTGNVQYDFDVSPLGIPTGRVPGALTPPAHRELTEKIAKTLKDKGIAFVKGVSATGDRFVNSTELRDTLCNEYKAIICEMEGAAVAFCCDEAGIEFSELRQVSDSADEGAEESYKAARAEMMNNAIKAIIEAI